MDSAAASGLPATLRLYRRLSSVAAALTPMLIRRRLRAGKEDPARSAERRGLSDVARPDGPLVWIHGASVGEVLAAAGLIERLRALDLRILLTSGTVTSAEIAARRFPADVIHQFIPYDSPRFVARFLDHWRPQLALFVESDLWPNLMLAGRARRLPMVLINGRMSPRSFTRWRRMQGTIAALLGCFEVCRPRIERPHDDAAGLDRQSQAALLQRQGLLAEQGPPPTFQGGDLDAVVFTVTESISLHEGEMPGGTRPRALIVHDLRHSAIQLTQIEGRCHRDGKRATIYYALAEDTVEERIAATVVGRMAAMEAMAGEDTVLLDAIAAAIREAPDVAEREAPPA